MIRSLFETRHMKNQYSTFSMDAVRVADLTQRHMAGLRHALLDFEPAGGYRGWVIISSLQSDHLPVRICHGQGSVQLAALFHFAQ